MFFFLTDKSFLNISFEPQAENHNFIYDTVISISNEAERGVDWFTIFSHRIIMQIRRSSRIINFEAVSANCFDNKFSFD